MTVLTPQHLDPDAGGITDSPVCLPPPIRWMRYTVRMAPNSSRKMGRIAYRLEVMGAESEGANTYHKIYICPHCDAPIGPTELDAGYFVPCLHCNRPSVPEKLTGEIAYCTDLPNMAQRVASFVRSYGLGDIVLKFGEQGLVKVCRDPEVLWKKNYLDLLAAARTSGMQVVLAGGDFTKEALIRGSYEAALEGFLRACL